MNQNLKFIIIPLVSIFYTCNPGEQGIPEQNETPNPYEYESFTQIDSQLVADIEMPEIVNMTRFDSTTVTVFKTIADGTIGELYFAENATAVLETVIDILNNHSSDNSDICFLVDQTGSMSDDNRMLIASMDTILGTIQQFKNVNVALAFYGDMNVDGRNWYSSVDFTTDYEKIKKKWAKYKPANGGDTPESVTDGAYKVINELSWTSTQKRVVLVLGDAPPLEPPLSDYTIDEIVIEAKNKDIVSNFYPVVVGLGWGDPGPTKSNLISGLYPNPASNYVNLVLNKESKYNVEIFGTDGSLKNSFEMNSSKQQINIEDYSAGVYVLRISTANGAKSDNIRFIKD